MSNSLTLAEVENSGAPGVASIKRWLESAKGSSPMARAKLHAAAAGQGLRQGGESLIVGGLLGAASVELATGLDVKKVPIDAAIGALGIVGGAALAHEEFGTDLPTAALQFSLANPALAAVIPGASRPERIEEDNAALNEQIPSAFWQEMREQKLVAANAPLPTDKE